VEGVGPVDSDEIVKGYEYENDQYVLLDQQEIDDIKLEPKKTLELVQFVGACEIPPLYFNRPYYVVPSDELAMDAYRVVQDALRQAEKIGLGQLAMRGREYLVAIKPCGDGLLLETLHYADEIRKADPLFSGISGQTADKELLQVATALIDRKTASFDAGAFKDRYTEALHELIERKRGSGKAKKVSAASRRTSSEGGNVVDLMATLKQSLEKTKSPARSRRKNSGRSGQGGARVA